MSFALRRARARVKGLFTVERYEVPMADASTGARIGLKNMILNWLMPEGGAGSEQSRKAAGQPVTGQAPPSSEPDRGDLGEGRGRVLYIRA